MDCVKKNKAFLGYNQEKAGEKGQLLQATGIQSTEDADLLNFNFLKKNGFQTANVEE